MDVKKCLKSFVCAGLISSCFFAFYRIYQVKFPFDIVLPWIFYFPLLGIALGPLVPRHWFSRSFFSWFCGFCIVLFLCGTYFNQNVSLHVFVSRQYYPYPPPPDFYLRCAAMVLSFGAAILMFASLSAICFHEGLYRGGRYAMGASLLGVLAGYLMCTGLILREGPFLVLFLGVLFSLVFTVKDIKALLVTLLACLVVFFSFSRQKDVFLLWRTGYNYKLLETKWTPYYYINFISFNKDRCLAGVYNYLMLWQVCKDTSLIQKELKFFHSEIGKGKESALVIGRTDGTTLLTLDYPKPHLKRATAVEIDPVVPELMRTRFSSFAQNIFKKKGFKAVSMDWRTFLEKDTQKYDIAVWDGLGIRLFVEPFTNFFQEDYLYTKESLALLFKKRLKKNGIFAGNWGSTQANEVYPLLANLPPGVHAIAFWTTFNDYPFMGLPMLLFAASRDKKRLDEIAAVLREIKPFREISMKVDSCPNRFQFQRATPLTVKIFMEVDFCPYKFRYVYSSTDNRPFLQKFIEPQLFILLSPFLFLPFGFVMFILRRQKKDDENAPPLLTGFFVFGTLTGTLFTLFMSRCSRLMSDGGPAQGFIVLMELSLCAGALGAIAPLKRNSKAGFLLTLVCVVVGCSAQGIFNNREPFFQLACLLGFFVMRALRFLPRPKPSLSSFAAFCLGMGFLCGNLLAQIFPWIFGYKFSGVITGILFARLFLYLWSTLHHPLEKKAG